jgi:hypothetical protein
MQHAPEDEHSIFSVDFGEWVGFGYGCRKRLYLVAGVGMDCT